MAYYNLYLLRSGFTGWQDTCNTGVSYYQGNFGIGEWFPSARLHVAKESGVHAEFKDSTHSITEDQYTSYIKHVDKSGLMVGTVGYSETGNKNLYIHSSTTGDTRFLIDDRFIALFNNSGEFGVNTQSPEAKIHVIQDSSTKDIAIFERTGTPDSPPDFIIKNDGRVGINVQNPDYTLHVSGHDLTSGVGTIYSESYVYKSGIEVANFNVNIDFDGSTFRNITLPTGVVTDFNTINGSTNANDEVKATTVRLSAPSGNAPIDFNTGIRFLGNMPTGLPSGKIGVVSFNSFGPSATDTVAVYREEGVSIVGADGPAGPPGTGDPGDAFTNKIIGGIFTLNPWQRGTGFYDIQSGEYSADRFAYLRNGINIKHDIIRDADVPPTGLIRLAEQCSLSVSCAQGNPNKIIFNSIPTTGETIEVRQFSGSENLLSDSTWLDTGTLAIYEYGNGVRREFESSYSGDNESNVLVLLNGLIQPPNTYSFGSFALSGTGVSFVSPPAKGQKIEFKFFSGVTGSSNEVFHGDGLKTGFSMAAFASHADCPLVILNGILQYPNINYNITGGTELNFFSPPYVGERIDIRHLSGIGGCSSNILYGNSKDDAFDLPTGIDFRSLVTKDGISQIFNKDYVIKSGLLSPYEFASVQHPIEGYNSIPLPQSDFTLSFNAKSNRSGSYAVAFRNEAMDESYVANYYLADKDVWHKIVLHCPPMSGTGAGWNYDSGIGLRVDWVLGAGSGYNAPSVNTWLKGNYLTFSGDTTIGCETENMSCVNGVYSGHELKIATAYLSKGKLSYNLYTPIRSIGDELELCERYYEKRNFLEDEVVSSAQSISNNKATGAMLKFGTVKRTFPEMSASPSGTFGVSNADYSTVDDISGLFLSKASQKSVSVGAVGVNDVLSQGNSTTISSKTPTGYIVIDSEFKV